MTEKENASQMNPHDMLEMVVRRKALVLIPFAVVLIGSIIAGIFMPRIYETATLIQVNDKRMIDPLVRGIAVAPNLRNEVQTLSKEILAWPKLEQLVTQLSLVSDAASPVEREDFIRRLKTSVIVQVRSNDIIEISYQNRSPVTAQKVVNTITQNFIAENSRLKRIEAANAVEFINEQLVIYRKKLESSEQDFSESQIDSQLRTMENRHAVLRDNLARLQKIIPSQITTAQNPVMAQLQSRLGQLESELTRVMMDAKEGNPRAMALRQEVETVKARIGQEMEKQTVKESVSTINPAFMQAEQEYKQLSLEIEYLKRRKEGIKKRSATPSREVSEEELKNVERAKRVDEDIYQMLLRQLESAYVSERLQDSEKGDRFTILEYARLPLRPVKPNMLKIIGMGFAGGLALGFGLAFMVENMNKTFQTFEQAKAFLPIPSLGYVSHMITEEKIVKPSLVRDLKEWLIGKIESKESLAKMRFVSSHNAKKLLNPAVSAQAVIYHEPKSKIAEEFRVIRAGIFEGGHEAPPPQVLLVTSSLRGEGKSTTSLNLSIAQADNGKKTLLIDCDLRRGGLHVLLSVPPVPGLTELISGKNSENSAPLQTIIPNLSAIPCGTRPARPSELLGSSFCKELIDRYRGMYDTIILDAPPVLNLPDVPVISKLADGIVMVIQSGATRRKDVSEAEGILAKANAPLLGFVLTGVRYFMPRYMYDYYYYEN